MGSKFTSTLREKRKMCEKLNIIDAIILQKSTLRGKVHPCEKNGDEKNKSSLIWTHI